jgi:hypothetical protein
MNRGGKRYAAGILGALLWSALSVYAWFISYDFYLDHYVFPLEKYGVLSPLRWQDLTFLIVFWILILGLFYVSYRLVRYAFGNGSEGRALDMDARLRR